MRFLLDKIYDKNQQQTFIQKLQTLQIFNYKLKKYEHLSKKPMSYDFKHLQYLRNKMLKNEW